MFSRAEGAAVKEWKNCRGHLCWYGPTNCFHASISRSSCFPPCNFLRASLLAGSWWGPAGRFSRRQTQEYLGASCLVASHTAFTLLLGFLWTRHSSRNFISIAWCYSITDRARDIGKNHSREKTLTGFNYFTIFPVLFPNAFSFLTFRALRNTFLVNLERT